MNSRTHAGARPSDGAVVAVLVVEILKTHSRAMGELDITDPAERARLFHEAATRLDAMLLAAVAA